MSWSGKQWAVSDMCRVWVGEANSELCLICREHGVERQTINYIIYVQNMGLKGEKWTVSDIYRTWFGEANSDLWLICTEHGLEGQTVNCVWYVRTCFGIQRLNCVWYVQNMRGAANSELCLICIEFGVVREQLTVAVIWIIYVASSEIFTFSWNRKLYSLCRSWDKKTFWSSKTYKCRWSCHNVQNTATLLCCKHTECRLMICC